MKKKLLLLGASGSIGQQTLDVIDQHPELFELVGFSVGQNIEVAKQICQKYAVKVCWLQHGQDELKQLFPHIDQAKDLNALVEQSGADWVINALIGFVGFEPTMKAIQLNKNVALANKETLVAGGSIVMEAVKKHQVKLTPIDSEHSAIYQCLIGHSNDEVHKIYLTASGGAFRDLEHDQLHRVTKESALKHPNWSMGAKITIDSATMMNKGLEVIEAHWLFGLSYDQIDVLIQPESLIHGMVEFKDTSIVAQFGQADMRLPILMALSDQKHLPLNQPRLSFKEMISLQLRPVKNKRYPLFDLAIQMGKKGNVYPTVMNGANEVAVKAFLEDRISYYDLEKTVIYACSRVKEVNEITFEAILASDELGRQLAIEYIEKEC